MSYSKKRETPFLNQVIYESLDIIAYGIRAVHLAHLIGQDMEIKPRKSQVLAIVSIVSAISSIKAIVKAALSGKG